MQPLCFSYSNRLCYRSSAGRGSRETSDWQTEVPFISLHKKHWDFLPGRATRLTRLKTGCIFCATSTFWLGWGHIPGLLEHMHTSPHDWLALMDFPFSFKDEVRLTSPGASRIATKWQKQTHKCVSRQLVLEYCNPHTITQIHFWKRSWLDCAVRSLCPFYCLGTLICLMLFGHVQPPIIPELHAEQKCSNDL